MALESVTFAECRAAIAAFVSKNTSILYDVAHIVADYAAADLIIRNIINNRPAQTGEFGYTWSMYPSGDDLVFRVNRMRFGADELDGNEATVWSETITARCLIELCISNTLASVLYEFMYEHLSFGILSSVLTVCSPDVPIILAMNRVSAGL